MYAMIIGRYYHALNGYIKYSYIVINEERNLEHFVQNRRMLYSKTTFASDEKYYKYGYLIAVLLNFNRLW